MKYIKLAWFFKNNLIEERNLFSISNIETDYNSYRYVCHCKKIKTIVNRLKTEYKCSWGNSTFLSIEKTQLDFINLVLIIILIKR